MAEVWKKSDSLVAKFQSSALAHKGAGTLTKERMRSTFKAFSEHAKRARWGANVTPLTITVKQLRGYVQARLDSGITPRVIQNEMSHLRRALTGCGRGDFADSVDCTNQKLGIPSATRKGKGKVVDKDVLASALQNAKKDTRALILLSRTLGLREREAVCAAPSLKEWALALESNRPVLVRHGTKGGRARTVCVRPDGTSAALAAVREAIQVVEDQGALVVSSSLKAAVEQHSDRLAKVGIKGENSGHSLRRAFALDQYKHYLSIGCSEKLALSRTSNDLGHGDGRGRWVFNNYIRNSL